MTTNHKNAIKRNARMIFTALFTIFAMTTVNAQLKEFTLEDLNFGGNNYHNMQPKNKSLTWWGDQLVRRDVEECYIVDKKTGKDEILDYIDSINKSLDNK